MTTELTILGWTLVVALAQIFMAAAMRTSETGLAFNMGPRDGPGPAVGAMTGRMQRAQGNLFETLPLFAAAILIAHVAHRDGALTWWGAWLYLLARIVYVPLYAFGVPVVRSIVFQISFLGLVLVLIAILHPA